MASKEASTTTMVRETGRGVLYITAAKIWFMISGWALIFVLPRLFNWTADGDETTGMVLYGMYSLVVTGVSFINNSIITGTIQSVSHFAARPHICSGAVRKTAMKTMALAGILIAGGYCLLADTIATHWFESTDPALIGLMRLSSVIIVAYSLYAVFIGTLNGLRRFKAQSLFDMGCATLKTTAIIGLVAMGLGVDGAVMGFLLAASAVAVTAGIYTRQIPTTSRLAISVYLSFASVLFLYNLALNLILMADLYILSGFISRHATAAGLSPTLALDMMNTRAAQYKAVQQISFLPYQAVLSITFVAFPLISRVTATADDATTRRYIAKTYRFTLVLLAGFAAVFSGMATGAMTLIFPAGYADAAPALRLLVIGIIAFGMMAVSNVVLNAAGRKWQALTVAAVGLGLIGALTSVFIHVDGNYDMTTLTVTAAGTSLGMLGAALVGIFLVFHQFNALPPLLSVLRVSVAVFSTVFVGTRLPQSGAALILGGCTGLLALYYLILWLLGEFTKNDLRMIKQVAGLKNRFKADRR